MAVSRGHTPPVNLKERIAALQQRNVSPNTHQSAQATPRGIPSPGSGGLRDKIAKFESKGGVPVPRGSFAMGAPQLAENAPARKRGELYGNRVPSLGRPSASTSTSRSGSPHPPTPSNDDLPGPRKRCISTGTALSTAPPTFSTDEPVPAIPPPAPRRNSLAVDFGPGRRAMTGVVQSSSPPTPDVETAEEEPQPPSPEAPEVTPVVEQPSSQAVSSISLELVSPPEDPPVPVDQDTPKPTEPPPVVEQPSSPADSGISLEGDSSPEDPPVSIVEESNARLDYEPPPQPSPSLPEPTSPPVPLPASSDIPSVVASPSTPPPEELTIPVTAAPVPSPKDSLLPSISAPNQTIEPSSQSKPTFKAVVHRRVAELPVPPPRSSLAPPQVHIQSVGGHAVENPPSPGSGDLVVLLEDAALLELKLTEGDDTSLTANELLATTPTNATFQSNPQYRSASTLIGHGSVPSLDNGSQSLRSVSIPSIREPPIQGEIPEEDETDGQSLASTTFSQRSPSHRKYLSNIYRLGRRSSSYMPGAYPRDSMSMSSEDSSPVTTPSDSGKRKGFGIAWPSTSPKRSGPNVSRSSSFADKIFNRNRTRSNVSLATQASERNSYQSSQPSLALSFPSESSPEPHPDSVDVGAPPTTLISPSEPNAEFSPASSFFDKDIFDAFPSVPQTLPPGFHLNADNSSVGRGSTLSVKGREQVDQRLSTA